MGRTVVLGAGVIGLTAAWELRKRGADVLVLDRGEPGAGCSAGNAGWIVPAISTPLPAPGLVSVSLRWMLRRDSPLYIQPRLDPRFGAWLAGFWRNCRAEPFQRGLVALEALNERTMSLFDALEQEGVRFEMRRDGLLFLGLSRTVVDEAAHEVGLLKRYRAQPPRVLSGAEAREIEPGLSASVAAGFLLDGERHVRPESLAAGLARRLVEEGVDIRSGVEVTGIERAGRRLAAIRTSAGSLATEQALIATGAWSGQLAARMGFRLPIEAGKGYSVTVDAPRRVVRRPLDLIEARVAVTPFDNGLRLAGTMEMSGVNLTLAPARVEAIRRAGRRYLGDWDGGDREHVWVGMRPLTPDGLPLIGPVPGCDGLFVATGHQMLGVTLAPATGVAIAGLMTGGDAGVELGPFLPARFRGAALR